MSDWRGGYQADIDYTYGYYSELNPLRAELALLNARLSTPRTSNACELGFGQGLSVNIHAAASATQWYANDFSPSHAAFALELAQAADAGAHLFDESFAEFASRDMPDFDFVGVHGIWSWISDANRTVIVDFIRRKLKVGGILYISYNTFPGWAGFAPMRHLIMEHAHIIGAEGQGIISRINGALEFAEKVLETNPLYARANPQVAERLKQIKDQNRNYVAHEYFNTDWLPMHFATLAKWLAPAKVSYACSAHYHDHIDAINMTAEQQKLVGGIPDALMRETVRDFMLNQRFRRDYWVKGARPLSFLDQMEAVRNKRVLLVAHRPDVPKKITGGLGEASLVESVYNPILDLLSNHNTRTIGQISDAVAAQGLNFPQVFQAILILLGAGQLAAVQDDEAISRAKIHTDKLNAHLIDSARSSNDVSWLASPVSGGGIHLGRFAQLFLLARLQGKKQPNEWVDFVWPILTLQGQRLIKDGKPLETQDENLSELLANAKAFAEKDLPRLKALQIA